MKRATLYRPGVNKIFLFMSVGICLPLLFHILSANTSATTFSRNSYSSSSPVFTANVAAGKPDRVNPICVDSHLAGLSTANIDKQLTLMQQAGIAWTRFDFYRSGVETAQGVYNWSEWDYIINDATSKGIHVIAILDQWGVPTWEPYYRGFQIPDTAAGYSGFASAAASHYKGQIQLYELGNEENTSTFWPPSPNASTYTQLLIAGYNSIKAADPAAKVVSGGLAPAGGSNIDPTTYLQQMYANGAKGHFDYLGMHPYSQSDSPDVASQSPSIATFNIVALLKNLLATEGDQSKQIMVTEVGWPTYSAGVTQTSQSAYITRIYAKIMHESYQYVALACIYDFVNDGTNTTSDEDNFGVLNQNYTPKPAYTAIHNAASDFAANFTAVAP